MLLWDIDSFKNVNDRYGHRAGDRVLQSVAAVSPPCCARRLRRPDRGEEFAVLLVGLASPRRCISPIKCAWRGRLAIPFSGTPVRVTVSCGVTELHEGDTPETVFDRRTRPCTGEGRGKNLCVAA